MKKYGLNIWANDNFIEENGLLKLNYKSMPSFIDIINKVRQDGSTGPILLRFPHLIKKQLENLYHNFNRAIDAHNYTGSFNAVFPLKVNHSPELVRSIVDIGKEFGYGLEAGSKAELILAMTHTPIGSPITVNGFKDKEMIELGFLAAQMGHYITLTIEGLNELNAIIEIAKKGYSLIPNIGIRARLHSSGSGIWAKSGGFDSKFGLTSTEMLEAVNLLSNENMLDKLSMIHFHIGSQMEDIAPIKKALREAGNIYAELRKLGASKLDNINIGGGLAVEYDQYKPTKSINYSIDEFSSSVVFLLREVMDAKQVKHPNIFTESGRFIVASHAMLVTRVLELFSNDYRERLLNIKEISPPLIDELKELNETINNDNAIEYLHDALDHVESIFTLFDLGYIDLQDRSNAEILTYNIIQKALQLKSFNPTPELEKLQVKIQEKYLINGSIFQSLPDYWGLSQDFPVIPLDKLNKIPHRAASLWDITCDSDGEIGFNPDKPLYLHDVNPNDEDYFLGFFNVGAYQETLGMDHNLFTKPTEHTVEITDSGFNIVNSEESKSILKILTTIGYGENELLSKLEDALLNSSFIEEKEKSDKLTQLKSFLQQNGYLRTIN